MGSSRPVPKPPDEFCDIGPLFGEINKSYIQGQAAGPSERDLNTTI